MLGNLIALAYIDTKFFRDIYIYLFYKITAQASECDLVSIVLDYKCIVKVTD